MENLGFRGRGHGVLSSLLLLVAFFLVDVQPAHAQLTHRGLSGGPCERQFGFFGGWDYEIEAYTDPNGNDIEIWCINNFRESHLEIRISYLVFGKFVKHHTVGGCYFENPDNNLKVNDDKPGINVLQTVTWENIDLDHPGNSFTFTYDWSTGDVTIVKSKNGQKKTLKYRPKAFGDGGYEDIGKLIEDPRSESSRSCPLNVSSSALGFDKTAGTLTVTTRGCNGRIPAPGAIVHLTTLDKRLSLFWPTNGDASLAINLDRGRYEIAGVVLGKDNAIVSSSAVVHLDFAGSTEITMNVPGCK